MSDHDDKSCGCGYPPHPSLPDIPAGLRTLAARQIAGFPEYRAAMLSAIPDYPALEGWRARGLNDLGIMLIEAWSAILDVTGFYDARIAERSYLPTAPDPASARRLAALIGHRMRPAMAARIRLAVEADGADPILLPKGTAFRSAPFDNQPPQVFELAADTVIWPERNRWKLAPVRKDVFDGTLRFMPRRAPSAGAIVVLWTTTQAAAVRVIAVESERAQDGATYQRAILDASSATGIRPLIGQPLSSLNMALTRQSVGENRFMKGTGSEILPGNMGRVTFEGFHHHIRPQDRAVVEIDSMLFPVVINSVASVTMPTSSTTTTVTTLPDGTEERRTFDAMVAAGSVATQVTFQPPQFWAPGRRFTLHMSPFSLGSPTQPAKTEIALSDLQASGFLVPPVSLGAAPSAGNTILQGARKKGELISGTVVAGPHGSMRFRPDASVGSFSNTLAAPLILWGNIVEAVRGQTVVSEVLGSGDAGRPFVSFMLKKKPLAWVEDPAQPAGRRPELAVRVNNVTWKQVDSFFGRGSQEQIYTVRTEPDGATRITFGDGQRGARPATGTNNVRADYRFGAGAAKPPPGSVAQIAAPVRGLASVRSPLAATGGADSETTAELRDSAPAGAMTLGRAVSLVDFEALARSFPGVVNATSAWIWDERRQRAAAKLWIIPNGGDPSSSLTPWLAAQAAPDLTVVVQVAGTAPFSTLSITLAIASGYDPIQVRAAAWMALFDPATGFLMPANTRIGAPLFRSALAHQLHQVAGVSAVVSMLLDGLAMPYAVGPGLGKWFDLQAGTTVR
ncbi:hypothetical protein [Nitrosospira sp. Nsp13]|uniref:hypothetical protein n=1 Tax=Nitrosospira sp. Nsp13 TaxID=1855332 RepID=UPI0008897D3C|nr:hypothetical protein [Nitrosospira sp. Nsp13]SCX79762.1 putative baseplate assembly protein [Nitrosospira sp. Nsp13]